MPGASIVPHRPVSAQPFMRRSRGRDVVPVACAAGLIRNFLVALEAEGGATTPLMKFAKARAERELAAWGEPAGEGGAA